MKKLILAILLAGFTVGGSLSAAAAKDGDLRGWWVVNKKKVAELNADFKDMDYAKFFTDICGDDVDTARGAIDELKKQLAAPAVGKPEADHADALVKSLDAVTPDIFARLYVLGGMIKNAKVKEKLAAGRPALIIDPKAEDAAIKANKQLPQVVSVRAFLKRIFGDAITTDAYNVLLRGILVPMLMEKPEEGEAEEIADAIEGALMLLKPVLRRGGKPGVADIFTDHMPVDAFVKEFGFENKFIDIAEVAQITAAEAKIYSDFGLDQMPAAPIAGAPRKQ